MPFLMVRNDITKMQVDAVVNPANNALMQGRGTSRAIYLAAGEAELTNACSQIVKMSLRRRPNFLFNFVYLNHS